jgi:hypothetical protein
MGQSDTTPSDKRILFGFLPLRSTVTLLAPAYYKGEYADVTVQVTHTQDAGGTSFFDTEMLQLDLTSGGLLLRESPTLHSTGQT